MCFRSLLISFLFFGYTSMAQLFSLMPKEYTGINFANHVVESKYLNIFTYEYLFNGGGVAMGDINNDGLNDIFFAGNMMPNKLYLNKGNFKFDDISKSANIDNGNGVNTGACMMDVNGDGWLDIFVCKSVLNEAKYRPHNMYINNKDNTFTDRAAEMGLRDSSFSMQAYFYDFDNDGDLDLYLLNHPQEIGNAKKIVLTYDKNGKLVPQKPKTYQYSSDRYYVNQNGIFVDKTKEAGLLNYAFGLSSVIADFNDDGYADIYTANDYTGVDFLYINNKNNTFREASDEYLRHFSYNSMGSDFADLDNDGLDDLMVVDMLPEENYRQKQFRQQMRYDQYTKLVKYGFKSQFVKNVLHKRIKNKGFSDVSHAVGVSNTDWSWAPLMADFDNNGFKDIYLTNGYYHDFTDQDFMKFKLDSIRKAALKEDDLEKIKGLMSNVPSVKVPNYFFANDGNMVFQRNPPNTGLNIPSFSNGAAYGDLDNDGDLDIVVSNINQDAFIFRNNLIENNGGNFLRIKLKSSKSPSQVYGAKIYVETPDGNKQYYRYYPIRGFMSSHEHVIHIGLAKNPSAKIRIELPAKNTFHQFSTDANKSHEINIDETLFMPKRKMAEHIQYDFKDITDKTKINHHCTENEYIDYKLEPLIPRKYSHEGPAIAVGDVNGDGREDIFVGGAKDASAVTYIQKSDGSFQKKSSSSFIQDKAYEDVNAEFIDIENDGDLDLIVVSGGNDYPNDIKKYPIRLYINSNGSFTKANSSTFPETYTSAKAIAIHDYNKDGFKDIFIGGCIVPGHYGRKPSSYLFKNINGQFEIDEFSKSNEKLSMINDADWIDLDRDGFKELIAVGEWTAPLVFKNENGKLENSNQALSNLSGWWRSITIADLNKDGYEDLVLGNYGINTRYNGSNQTPMTAFVNDFDKNGSTDVLIGTYNGNKSYPVMIRDNVLDQMPFLKKRFNRYEKYSNASTNDIFTPSEMVGADTLYVNFMKSLIIYTGKKLEAKVLPFDCQTFPVNGVITHDINKDGNPDLLIGGNDYHVEIETGRLDAGQGVILESTNNNEFFTNNSNNLNLQGDVKVMKKIKIGTDDAIIVGRNNSKIQILKIPK